MRSLKSFILAQNILFLILFLSACASNSGRSVELGEELQRQLSDIRELQAEHAASISELKTEVRKSSGVIEEIQHAYSDRISQIESVLGQVTDNLPPPSVVPAELLSEAERSSVLFGSSGQGFREGLKQLRRGNFEQAASQLAGVVNQVPPSPLTDEALFWLGIANDGLGNYDKAISAYSDIFQRFPKGKMYAPALLYLGKTFIKVGNPQDAKISFEKLIDEQPRSTYSAAAKELLKGINQKK